MLERAPRFFDNFYFRRFATKVGGLFLSIWGAVQIIAPFWHPADGLMNEIASNNRNMPLIFAYWVTGCVVFEAAKLKVRYDLAMLVYERRRRRRPGVRRIGRSQ